MTDDAGPRCSRSEGSPRPSRALIANEDISLTLHQGEIHCLLGENGAGKSTLMNVVFGLYQPDAGEIAGARASRCGFRSSAEAIAKGIGMVHQHFQLIPVFTVAENVILGDELSRRGLLDIGEARRRILEHRGALRPHRRPRRHGRRTCRSASSSASN